MKVLSSFEELKEIVICCRKCPRLVEFRESVPPRASYQHQNYWRRPVPGFGDPKAWLLIVGLAPSAHGGNRTGRIFTGDESARFLFKVLHKAGFANQPVSESLEDGLKLTGCYITAVVKCVPPKNKPTQQECSNCNPYLQTEFTLLKNVQCVLALGRLAFDTFLTTLKEKQKLPFQHGVKHALENKLTLYASFHPSPQNTYTGKLTEPMLVNLLEEIKNNRWAVR